MYINFATVNDVALFTTTCDKYDEDIDIYFGHMCFDAKSLGANMILLAKMQKLLFIQMMSLWRINLKRM